MLVKLKINGEAKVYKVSWKHYRFTKCACFCGDCEECRVKFTNFNHDMRTTAFYRRMNAKGGTMCKIDCIEPNNNVSHIGFGIAFCSVQEKQFVKETGRKISLTNALGSMCLGKEYRKVFWMSYFASKRHDLRSQKEIE